MGLLHSVRGSRLEFQASIDSSSRGNRPGGTGDIGSLYQRFGNPKTDEGMEGGSEQMIAGVNNRLGREGTWGFGGGSTRGGEGGSDEWIFRECASKGGAHRRAAGRWIVSLRVQTFDVQG